jgi:hypothetical protein
MSMGKTADNIEGCGRGNIGFASKCPLDHVDDVRGKVRDIAQGLVLHLVAIAVSTTQQVSLINLIAAGTLNTGYMYWSISVGHTLLEHTIRDLSRGMLNNYWLHLAPYLASSWL